MGRVAVKLAVAVLAQAIGGQAAACSPAESVYRELPLEVARSAYVIDGIVTRPFNAAKKQAEIITATRIYVGDADVTHLEIARDRQEFLRRRPGSGFHYNSCDRGVFDKRGARVTMFVLYPVPAADRFGRARWAFGAFDTIATQGPGLSAMLTEAIRLGRLKVRLSLDVPR